MTDPVQDLVHDHADINRRVLALGGANPRARPQTTANGMAVALVHQMGELRELLFLHFAREEEGLFSVRRRRRCRIWRTRSAIWRSHTMRSAAPLGADESTSQRPTVQCA